MQKKCKYILLFSSFFVISHPKNKVINSWKKMLARILFVMMMMFPIAAYAGDGDKTEKKYTGVMKGVMWLKTTLDSMAMAKVDRRYIEQPKHGLAVEVRTEASENILKMESSFPYQDGSVGQLTVKTSNGFTTAIGAWIGYRGYGIGLSKNLSGGGSSFSFGATGGSFGINFRINSYDSDTPDVTLSYSNTEKPYNARGKVNLDDPIHVRSVFLDGYYMFNGKHFSYAAAYDQSLIQRRSAGSLMAGAMYFHSSVSYDRDSNWPLVAFMKGMGQFKFTQACIGLGYAYNWVPAKGWLVSIQAMPMLQFYNRLSAYLYNFYYEGQDITKDMVVDFSAAEETAKYTEEEYLQEYQKVSMREREVQKTNNRIGWNFDARLAVIYNWERFYVRAYGHYNRFRYSNDKGYGRMAEWRAYAAVGFRF